MSHVSHNIWRDSRVSLRVILSNVTTSPRAPPTLLARACRPAPPAGGTPVPVTAPRRPLHKRHSERSRDLTGIRVRVCYPRPRRR